VNHFHAAGGTPFLVGTLIDAGLLHEDVLTLAGPGLARYRRMPAIDEAGALVWQDLPPTTGNPDVLRPVAEAFEPDGGLRMLSGTLGNAVIKVSSVAAEHRLIEAPARVFTDQVGFLTAFSRRELDRDVVVVIRDQGPSANGMPELHALTPSLGVLQKRGHQVALLTDGRMSGASGSIPAAIHVTPESVHGGPIARLRDGDVVRLDADAGTLDVLVDPVEWEGRSAAPPSHQDAFGTGRELFASFRNAVGRADQGAHVFGPATPALTHLQETR